MTTYNDRFEFDKLSITVAITQTEATITWTGESDAREPAVFLKPVMARLVKLLRPTTPVTLDFRPLSYVNSSTVAAIITLIRLFDSNRLKTILVYNTDITWQRVNCSCMKAIARTLNNVQVA